MFVVNVSARAATALVAFGQNWIRRSTGAYGTFLSGLAPQIIGTPLLSGGLDTGAQLLATGAGWKFARARAGGVDPFCVGDVGLAVLADREVLSPS